MSKQQAMSEVAEIPGLRAVLDAEPEAIARIEQMKRRKADAEAAIVLRKRDRDALASRAASGAEVTGADVRKVSEAIEDLQATVKLLDEALPQAVRHAYEVASARGKAVAALVEERQQPYRAALAAAEERLLEAERARDQARADVEKWPPGTQELLEAHGLNEASGQHIARLRDDENTNRTLAQWNAANPHLHRPLRPWP